MAGKTIPTTPLSGLKANILIGLQMNMLKCPFNDLLLGPVNSGLNNDPPKTAAWVVVIEENA